jgi:hypothetical protein
MKKIYQYDIFETHHKEYCVSKPFDATEADELLKIVFILRNLKDLILNR